MAKKKEIISFSDWRILHQMNQTDVSEDLGISQSYVSRADRGKATESLKLLFITKYQEILEKENYEIDWSKSHDGQRVRVVTHSKGKS